MKIQVNGLMRLNPSAGDFEVQSTLEPVVTIDGDEVESRSSLGGGPGVARVDVKGDLGKIARFWVSVSIKNGRPVLSVSTVVGEKQVSRKLTGSFNL